MRAGSLTPVARHARASATYSGVTHIMKLLSRSAVLVALLAAGAAAYAAPIKPNRPATAEKAIVRPPAPTTTTPDATVTYSGAIPATPTYNRPTVTGTFTCGGLSGVGTAVGYNTQPFTVDVSGAYTFTTTVYTGTSDPMMFLYTPTFNPAAATTNCVAGDDDTAGGGRPTFTTNLTAGTQYVLVTTTFDNGASGTFTNEITGPGTAGFPPSADLSVTINAPSGVPSSGPFTYAVGVANGGPDPATGVVATITLGTNVTLTGSTCGATAAGSTVTWNVGTVAAAGNATCTLNVTTTGPFVAVSTTATVSASTIDPDPTDNSATASNQAQPIGDPSFEAGTPNPSWTESSDVFG